MKRQGKYTKRVTTAQHVKRNYHRHFRWWRHASWKKRIFAVMAPIVAVLILIPILTYLYFVRDISDMDRLMNRNNTGVVLYANDAKTVIYSSGRAAPRDIVPLSKISKPMQQALVASEDKNFYDHNGFSILSTLRAVYGYIVSRGAAYGGSTITQQLAKMTLLGNNRSFLREYQTFSISVAIESKYTKDQILDMYLNSVYFGEGAFGVNDAAKVYFGTTPDKLDLAQSAMLIGLLPAPSIYSPISGNREYAVERQTTVLSRMQRSGYITDTQVASAQKEKLKYEKPQSPINDSAAPHFSEMVLSSLYSKYGEEAVTRRGYRVVTTLDPKVQKALQQSVDDNMPFIKANGGSNAAAVALDPTTGEIRGLVGSYDWNDPDFGKVNIITSKRQPGSSFKPIYYSNALADGVITPATILQDVPKDFGGYKPLDADRQFRGDVTVRSALNMSLNIPSVEVMQKYGISRSIDAARRMGIESVKKDTDCGLALALGCAEVTPLELASAYTAFADGGTRHDTIYIKSITTKYSEKIFQAKDKSSNVISPQGAFLISNILADTAARAPIFGNTLTVYDSSTGLPKTAAIKTGTTNDSKDAWTVGYTPQLVIVSWVGNNDNKPMANGGSVMAGPIVTKTLGKVLAGVDTKFSTPPGVVQRDVCYSNHGLADKAVSGKTYKEWFLSTALPSNKCSVSENKPKPSNKPDSNNSGSNQSVTMSLVADPSSGATTSDSVTFTVTLSDSSITGTVKFTIDNDDYNSQIIGGTASVVVPASTMGIGMHQVTAQYLDQPDKIDSVSINYTISPH